MLPESNLFPLFLLYFCPPFVFPWSRCRFWHDAVIQRRLFLEKSFFHQEKGTYDWVIFILNNTRGLTELGVFVFLGFSCFVLFCLSIHKFACQKVVLYDECLFCTWKTKTQLKGNTLIVSLQTFLSSLKCDKNNFEQHAELSLYGISCCTMQATEKGKFLEFLIKEK